MLYNVLNLSDKVIKLDILKMEENIKMSSACVILMH
jgi:hypothetical protein